MPKHESRKPDFDWRLTSFEGSRREQLRRWAQLPLEKILLAIEEMQDLAHQLGTAPAGEPGEAAGVKEGQAGTRKQSMRVAERPARYGVKGRGRKKK
jgi:hypothetical protein